MFATRARFTASTIRRASATFRASGFSQSIALPAPAAAIAISACESLGVQMSTMSITGSAMIAFQSVTALSQPSVFAARPVPSRSRPQIAAIRISAGKSKKRGACRQALEWARPMNLVPMSATERVRRFGILAEDKHLCLCAQRVFNPLIRNRLKACLAHRLGKSVLLSFLTKNVQATDFEHERFLRVRVQLVAHFFQTPDSFQDCRGVQLPGEFLCRLGTTFEQAPHLR